MYMIQLYVYTTPAYAIASETTGFSLKVAWGISLWTCSASSGSWLLFVGNKINGMLSRTYTNHLRTPHPTDYFPLDNIYSRPFF